MRNWKLEILHVDRKRKQGEVRRMKWKTKKEVKYSSGVEVSGGTIEIKQRNERNEKLESGKSAS